MDCSTVNSIWLNLQITESEFQPKEILIVTKTNLIEEVLSTTQEILIRFLISLSPPEQIILSQEAQSVFLKNPEGLAHYCVPSQDDDED